MKRSGGLSCFRVKKAQDGIETANGSDGQTDAHKSVYLLKQQRLWGREAYAGPIQSASF
jgi:hypothetical protein